jgi:ribosomal protein L30E
MAALESVDAKFERENVTFHANLIKVENAVMVFFYEGTSKLGTVALAMPGIGEEKAGRSSVLLGGKYLMVSRALAERAAGAFGKIAVVSINTAIEEGEALRIYAKLLDDLRKA